MKLLPALIVIFFSLLPLPLAAYATIFNPHNYPPLFENYGIQERFPQANVIAYNEEVLDYLKGNNPYPSSLPLNDRELQHMRDVQRVMSRLIFFVNSLLLVCLLSVILAIRKKQDIRRPLFIAGIINLSFCLVLLLAMIFFFDASFTLFHLLFFDAGTWVFPAGDVIVNLYPQGLFFDMGVSIFLLAIFFSLVLVAGKAYIRKGTKQRHEN